MNVSDQDKPPLWLHLKYLKSLAKMIKRNTKFGHMHAMELLSRSAGYAGWNEAVHHARPLTITFEEWLRRVSIAFDKPASELLAEDEWPQHFQRLFQFCSTELAEDEQIPAHVGHEKTVVDALVQEKGSRKGREE